MNDLDSQEEGSQAESQAEGSLEESQAEGSLTRAVARRVLRRPLPLLILAAAVVGMVTDLLWSDLRTFWTEHQLFTALLVTELSFVFAGAVFDAWNKEADALRYRRLRNIAYKALIDWIISARDSLVWLVAGDFPYRPREPLTSVPQPVSELIAGTAEQRRGERLDRLLREAEFANHAYDSVCMLTKHARDRVGLWAPSLGASRGLTESLNHVVLLVDCLEELERPLNRTHRRDGTTGIVRKDLRRSTCQLWDELITSSIVFEESLKHELGPRWEGWVTSARELLSPEGHKHVDMDPPVVRATERLKDIRLQVHRPYRSSHEVKRKPCSEDTTHDIPPDRSRFAG